MSNIDFVIDEIKKIELKDKETDIIVISFDMYKFNLDTVRQVFETVTSSLSEYHIAFIPKEMEVEVKNIDSLIQYLENIKKDYPAKFC